MNEKKEVKNEEYNKKDSSSDDSLNQFKKRENKLTIFRTLINTILSLVLLVLSYFVINNYETKWVIPFYLTLWSFFMNTYYIVSCTVIDLIRLFKTPEYCVAYNNFVRVIYFRLCFPISMSIVFLYWMLIFLGDRFQYNSRSLYDNLIAFSFHGLIFIFFLFDTFTYPHLNKFNHKWDVFWITVMTMIYFIVLAIAKYVINYNPYDFMYMSNKRQIAAASFLIYIAILDCYVLLVLIAKKSFINEKDFELIRINTKNEDSLDGTSKVTSQEKKH